MEGSKPPAELNTAESLEVARAYVGLLGEVPSSFSSTLRALIADEEKHGGKLSPSGRYLCLRLLKSRGVLATVYYAALTFRQERLSSLGEVSPDNLTQCFSPIELAGLIGLLYLNRRMRSFSSKEVWDELYPGIRSALELGGHVGIALPRLGFTMGMYVGAFRDMTLCLFQKQDAKAFKEYRRQLRNANLAYDLHTEQSVWGCTRADLGAVLLQMLGFGVPVANAYAKGMCGSDPLGHDLAPEEYRYKIGLIWINALLATGAIPDMAHKGEYYPTEAAAALLLQEVGIVRQQGTKYGFLDKTKEDVSPSKTPQLFQSGAAVASDEEQAAVPVPEMKDEDLEKI